MNIDVTFDVEGLILPNAPLSNYQLIEAAKKLKIKQFRGVFVRDELPQKPRAVECGILNTGDSSTNGFIGYVGANRDQKRFVLIRMDYRPQWS